VLQTLLHPSSEFASNHHGVNVVLLRLKDLADFDPKHPETGVRLEAHVSELIQELRSAPSRFSVPMIFCLCPPPPELKQDPQRVALAARLTATISAALDEVPGVHFLHYRDVERLYPVETVHDPEAERLGRIPYTEEYFCALATAIVRQTHALFQAPYKVIALDCDNTLWGGICGEDGPGGICLDAPHRALQEFMREQREAGMLLVLASKNNEEDVFEVFRLNPEMPLQPHHFLTWRLNWEPKADNIAWLSEQLGLGLDSFIFIDDNPKECAELQQALPEVLTLALPEDIDQTEHFLNGVWAFDHPVITEEDRNRNVYYAQAQEFGNEIRRASSLEDFISSLDLRVVIGPVNDEKIPRVAQLTQRTNQFNATTIRRSESEIRALIAAGTHECYTVDVADRFGTYGLVGVMMVETERTEMRLDTMLLSCRALGRGVEHRMLASLGQIAAERGIPKITTELRRTTKNRPAQQFFESLGFGVREETQDGFVQHLPSAEAAEVRWAPALPQPDGHGRKPHAPRTQTRRSVDYAFIAKELGTVPQILEAMRKQSRPAADLPDSMTGVERELAHIWAELLEQPSISVADNFFDLGGHSLLAVLLLLRIRQTFDVELSIDDVYSGSLTLSDLAARIEAARAGGIGAAEYEALLAEIEGMSDEEARELLAREDGMQT
jgi:FkbH-like protein